MRNRHLRIRYNQWVKGKKALIIAHRGFSQRFPENTIISFQKGVEYGADGIELDVHATKDGQVCVHHDYFLGRTDDGEGLISDRTYNYLKKLDAGGWFSKKYAGESIPLLQDVLAAIGNKVFYQVELKGIFDDQSLRKVISIITKHKLIHKTEFTSFHPYLLLRAKALAPQASFGLLFEKPPSWMPPGLYERFAQSELLFGGIDTVHIAAKALDKRSVTTLKRLGLKVHAFDCNTLGRIRRAFEFGVDSFTTNNISQAVRLRDGFL